MAEGICSRDGCSNKRYARGYCRLHYCRAVTSGELPTTPRRGGLCSVADCGQPHYGKGFCKPHYRKDYHLQNRERSKQTGLAWLAANRERARQAQREYEIRNRDRLNQRKQAWRAANQERLRAYARKYNREHPERQAAYLLRNAEKCALRARAATQRRRFGPDGRPVDFAAILAEHGMTCHICGGAIADRSDLHFDHVIPLSRGGAHSAENIRPSHAFCNQSKGARIA